MKVKLRYLKYLHFYISPAEGALEVRKTLILKTRRAFFLFQHYKATNKYVSHLIICLCVCKRVLF